jgi:hypothetical protein
MFFRKTIDGLLSDITNKVDALRAVEAYKIERSDKLATRALKLRNKSESEASEARRAGKLAEKFEGLISV